MKREEFKAHIKEIEGTIGYVFRDESLLTQAFTRTSFCNEHHGHGKTGYQSNEVLEFFGDSVLSLSIITYLLSEKTERYEFGIRTELGEGDFSNLKSKLSDKKNLSASTLSLGLQRFLIMGEGDEKLGIAREPSVMEDLFESIIGAVYIDSDMDVPTVMKVVARMLDMSVYRSSGAASVSAKNALQEWCADKSRRLPAPIYKTLAECGPDHKKEYERGVYVDGKLIAKAKGKNLKSADTACAELALKLLRSVEEKNGSGASEKGKKLNTPPGKCSKTPVGNGAKGAPVSCEGSTARLRELAASMGLTTPRFRDLGEEQGQSGSYRVECKVGELSGIGTAKDRHTARELASHAVISMLPNGGKKAAKARPVAKKK